MRCHYEVLDVPFDVNGEDLKKAYRKAAFRWHPDKNLADVEGAKQQFQLVQQAYEVLSDGHERAWYDAHRDAILKGGLGDNYKDDSLNVYPYFSSSCYSGYGDDEKGFYTVYKEVFNKIAAEDIDYMSASDDPLDIPSFGASTSDFQDVVSRFYKYWQDYTTKKCYSWLGDDIKDLPNRRIAKLVEKDNKKKRDRARKERNEEIRNLVAFVRKRDKRVQAQSILIELQAQEKARVAAEKKKAKVKERQEELKRCQEAEWTKHADLEAELKNIEKTLCDPNESEDSDALFCIACNKFFKTTKSFANHENSKKHKDNVKELKQQMLEEEMMYDKDENNRDVEMNGVEPSKVGGDQGDSKDQDEGESISEEDQNSAHELSTADIETEDSDKEAVSEVLSLPASKKTKKNRKKVLLVNNSDSDEIDFVNDLSMLSKKQRRKLPEKNVDSENNLASKEKVAGDTNNGSEASSSKSRKKGKEAPRQKADEKLGTQNKLSTKTVSTAKHVKESISGNAPSIIDHCCVMCKSIFPSKNKLFEHLKTTGHSVYLPGKGIVGNVKKGKVKQK